MQYRLRSTNSCFMLQQRIQLLCLQRCTTATVHFDSIQFYVVLARHHHTDNRRILRAAAITTLQTLW
jgi:hypothetical protein